MANLLPETLPPSSGPRSPGPAAVASAGVAGGFPRKLARYFALTLQQAHEDGILLTASALAFVTILSLIPLLAAFSFVGARVFNQYSQRSLEVFVQILPYSDETVTEKIAEFLEHAGTIHGFGVAVFFFTTLLAFSTVEETLNKIWNVTRSRPFRVRLLSFALLLFWGPLLIGATFSSLIVLRQSPALRRLLQESLLLNILPFLAIVLGLTLLYWRVPYTSVRFQAALAGGLLAGILLEVLRQGFATYVEVFGSVNVVYGSFAFALLFMLSIELTWGIVLLGSEAAYTAQHFRVLARGLHRNPPLEASWVGLATLSAIARRFARGEPALPHDALAARLGIPERELDVMLRPLLSHKLLRPSRHGGYLLTTAPQQLSVDEVFAAYDHRARRGAELPGGELGTRLEGLVTALADARANHLGEVTVADLLETEDAEGPHDTAGSE